MPKIALAAMISLTSTPLLAQACKSSGDLSYIGNTAENARSVWLSTTQAGRFALEAAQGNTPVDRFTRAQPGPHLSLSPFVSNGSGGVHRLFERGAAANGGDCLVDTQNQKGGIQLPGRPPGPIRPPLGIVPPIGILPPTGITPGLPTRPIPPIGTLPPTGITPTLPGRPVPPIATLPPTGITPGRPIRPTPPIGTLPPTGVTPGLPTRPTPPIGTLPPTGITPGLPTRPSPPIGTLPPSGVTPERPSVPTIPPGSRPPPVAVTVANQDRRRGALGEPAARCSQEQASKNGAVPCDPQVVPFDETGRYPVPITPGRDLAPPSPWNVWTNVSVSRTDDDRARRATEIDGSYFSIGIDRYVSTNTVVGLQLEMDQSKTVSFDGAMRLDTTTVSAGPYFATLLNKHWSMSGLLTVGNVSTDTDILNLNGSTDRLRTHAVLSVFGQYQWGSVFLRPQAYLDYAHTQSDEITLEGDVGSIPVRVDASVQSGWTGSFAPSIEFSRVFGVRNGLLAPYTEIGAIYAFGERESGFSASQSSDFESWAGTIEAGFRYSASGGFFVETSLGYNSLFQDGVDSFDASLFLSWRF